MLYSKAFIRTQRETPSDAVASSHALMLRAGLVRRVGNGLFAYLPPGLRAFRKLEAIVREELAAAGALEAKPAVMTPASLWHESGRFGSMGEAMLVARNRLGEELVVSPTAEEVFVAIARGEVKSYRDLPLNLYQINAKYRDEIRPRYGVMRAREFTMMDSYSFDVDEAGLDLSYRAMADAYRRIFARCGLSTIEVKADTGAMGGDASEEFMVESDIGDDTLMVCSACGYAANVEKAACAPDAAECAGEIGTETVGPARVIATPGVGTIDELVVFLGSDARSFVKTLLYKVKNPSKGPFAVSMPDEAFVAACVRGDLDVNETKLASALGASEVVLAVEDDVVRITGAPVGFAGPVGLRGAAVVADPTVMALPRAIVGALQADAHLVDVVPGRDFAPDLVADLRSVREGDPCPACRAALKARKGNELGHVFKLGTKYTEAMSFSFLDKDGASRLPLMGCYGIGIDRTLASVIEEHHDADGIVWPAALAPYEVALIPISREGATFDAALRLHDALGELGVDVLLDDRNERPGVKFKDADLCGYPIQIVVGDRHLPDHVEWKLRTERDKRLVPLSDAPRLAKEAIAAMKRA